MFFQWKNLDTSFDFYYTNLHEILTFYCKKKAQMELLQLSSTPSERKKKRKEKKVDEEEKKRWMRRIERMCEYLCVCVLWKSALLAEKAIESLLECGQNFKI